MTDQGIIDTFINDVESLFTRNSKGEDGFGTEFMKIKQLSAAIKLNPHFHTSAGEKAENKKKNRYKDILPFDYVRVKLSSDDNNSDYINASNINGPDNKVSYIASQGPLPHTVNDFWRMLWDFQVKVLIMVCKVEENGKPKCERYWSDSNDEVKVFGDITVTLESIQVYDGDTCQRVLMVKRGKESRIIHQLHYQGWPDHGVPRTRDAILKIIDTARSLQDYRCDDKSPLCVHCSAGCGRTGVVIVIDYFRHLLMNESFASNLRVFDVVTSMRRQRPAIVQTRDQYEFVHLAISEMCTKYMESRGKALTSNLSKSLTSTTYENVTFQEKPSSKPKPNKLPNHKKKSSDGSYENFAPSEPLNQSPKKISSSGHFHDQFDPPPKPIKAVSKPSSNTDPSNVKYPTPQFRSSDTSPAKSMLKPGAPPPALKPVVLHTKQRFSPPNSRPETNPPIPANAKASASDKADVVVTESIQTRKERLLSLGLATPNNMPKKTGVSASVVDLRSVSAVPIGLTSSRLHRTSSMDNSADSAARFNNSNNNNELFDKNTLANNKPNGKLPLKPPVLPRKSNSIKVQYRRNDENLTVGKTSDSATEVAVKPGRSSSDATYGVENYCRIAQPRTKRSSDYDMLVRSIKYKDGAKNKSISDGGKDKVVENIEAEVKTTVDNVLYTPAALDTSVTSSKGQSRSRAHVYSEVDDFPQRNRDFGKIPAVNSKPLPPSKPKREEVHATPGDVYSMADNNSNISDVYAQTNKTGKSFLQNSDASPEPVYCAVSANKADPIYAFPNDPSNENDGYVNLPDENTNTDCAAVRPRTSSNVSSHSNSRHSGGGLPSTPPIPKRTPESHILVPSGRAPESNNHKLSTSDRPIGNSGYQQEGAYEYADFDYPAGWSVYCACRSESKECNSRRPSATNAVKPNSTQAKANVLGKFGKQFTAAFQQIGSGGNKSDDTQNQRTAKPTSDVHEPVILRSQDIGFGKRLNRKPKGKRALPNQWKKK